MKKIAPEELSDNPIRLIGRDWMLITAGQMGDFNTMTASWGGVGHLWNVPVAFVFVRPERYTYGFMEREEGFTLSFFDGRYRTALKSCLEREVVAEMLPGNFLLSIKIYRKTINFICFSEICLYLCPVLYGWE